MCFESMPIISCGLESSKISSVGKGKVKAIIGLVALTVFGIYRFILNR